MKAEKRRKVTKQLEKWTPYFIILCTFVGALLGSLIYYFVEGEVPYEVLTAGAIVAVVLTIIQVIKQSRKKDNIPEADERVIRNIFYYFAYTSHITLALIFIALGVYTVMGQEVIELFHLWLFFFTYLIVVGIGAMVVVRR